jgi:hypothetical protein
MPSDAAGPFDGDDTFADLTFTDVGSMLAGACGVFFDRSATGRKVPDFRRRGARHRPVVRHRRR